MIERVKPKVSTKTSSDNSFEKNHDVNQNNINIKIVQPPVEKPKKKKRKYKKRIPKKVIDDFLQSLNSYTSEGGTDTITDISDIKNLKESEIVDLTNSLKNKTLALQDSKKQLALQASKPQLALSSSSGSSSSFPPRQSSGFQRTLPSLGEPIRSSLSPIIPLTSSLPTQPLPPQSLPTPSLPSQLSPPTPSLPPPQEEQEKEMNPLFEKPKFLSGLTTSEMEEVNSNEYEPDNFTRLKEIYKKYFGNQYPNYPGINKVGEMDNIRLMLNNKNRDLKETKTTDPKIEDLPEETQQAIDEYNFENCALSRRTGMLNPCLGEYENYLKHLIDTNDRNELLTQYQQALKKLPSTVDTNISLVEQIVDLSDYVPNVATDNFYKYESLKKKVVQSDVLVETEITPEDLKLLNIAEDEENLETLQSIYKKYYGKYYEYKRQNIGERVFDIIQELKKPKSLKSDEIIPETIPEKIPELTYETITEYTPETCKNKTGRELLSGYLNPCLREYENYLKSLIDTNNRNELNIQYEKALGKQPSSASNNVLLVNQIIELTDYVPQLSNDNFFKYESLKKLSKPDEVVPEVIKTPSGPSEEDIEITRKLQILGPFFNRFYPGSKFKPLNNKTPSDDELVFMIKLMDDDFFKGNYTRDVLKDIFKDKYIEYSIKNENINTDIQEGRSANLTQAVQQRINEGNEVTIALLVTLASYDEERPEFIFQYNYVPELSDSEIAVYYETDGRKIFIGNRGSSTLEDWVDTDITLAFGKLKDGSARWSRTLQKILNISSYNFKNDNNLLIFTGDSLGGSLAYEQAVYVHQNNSQFYMDSYAITFNAGQGLPSSSQFFAFLKTNLFNDEWYETHLLNFTVTGDVLSNVGRAVGAGVQIPVPWSVGNQPHNLQNFVKFNVDSYKDFVDSTQEPVIKKVIDKGIAEQVIEEKTGPNYTALGIAVGAGVLVGGLAGLLTKNPQTAARLGYYSTAGIAETLGTGAGISGRNIARGALAGGTLGSVEEGIRQNLIAGSKPQYFGSLPQQYKAPKTTTPQIPRLGDTPFRQPPPPSGRSLNTP